MFDLGTAVGYLMLDTSGLKKGASQAKSYLNTIEDNTATLNDRLSATSGLFTSVGTALTKYVSIPLAGLATGSVLAASTFQDAMKDIKSSTGASAEEMEKFESVLRNVYTGGYGEGYEDIADAISQIRQQLGELSETDLTDMTEGVLLLRDTFEYDLGDSIRATDALMQNFAISYQEAMDYIVYGTQQGLDYSNELLDTIIEYSPQFKKLGLDASDMFNVFIAGAQNGAWNLDKVGDALKELSIRAIDMSTTSVEAYEILGLNADLMAQQFAKGGDSAKNAFNVIIESLKQIDDPVQQSIAGVGLFGTMWEDLGPDVVLQLNTIKDASSQAAGAMNELDQARMDGFTYQLETTKRKAADLGVEMGLVLLPYVSTVLDKVGGLIDKFAGLDEGTQKLIIGIGLFVGLLGPFILLLGQLSQAIIVISGALGILGISASSVMPYILAAVAAIALLVGLIAILKGNKSDLDELKNINDQIPSYPSTSGGVPRGSYAAGLDYVPRDMPVNVHEGEAILTKEENKNRNITPQRQEFTVNAPIYLSGREIGKNSYKFVVQEGKLIGPSLVGGNTL